MEADSLWDSLFSCGPRNGSMSETGKHSGRGVHFLAPEQDKDFELLQT